MSEEEQPVDEQVLGVMVGYAPEKESTYAVLYGQFGSEVLLQRDDDMKWWAIVHKIDEDTEHLIEPPVEVPNPILIATAIAEGNDETSEALFKLIEEAE